MGWPWKYRCWFARGSIFVGVPVEVSLLACPWKYLCWPGRGSIVVDLTVVVSVLACPWKSAFGGMPVEGLYPPYSIYVGQPVEVSWLALPWKSLWWPARGSIFVGLTVEGSVLACPWKYLFAGLTVEVSVVWTCPWKDLRWPARGRIFGGLPVEVWRNACVIGSYQISHFGPHRGAYMHKMQTCTRMHRILLAPSHTCTHSHIHTCTHSHIHTGTCTLYHLHIPCLSPFTITAYLS